MLYYAILLLMPVCKGDRHELYSPVGGSAFRCLATATLLNHCQVFIFASSKERNFVHNESHEEFNIHLTRKITMIVYCGMSHFTFYHFPNPCWLARLYCAGMLVCSLYPLLFLCFILLHRRLYALHNFPWV